MRKKAAGSDPGGFFLGKICRVRNSGGFVLTPEEKNGYPNRMIATSPSSAP